jgi:dienelactone hydrolase
VLHELPGLVKEDLRFAGKLAAAGFRSVVPLMFGQPNDSSFLRNYWQVCGAERFDCGSAAHTSPETGWIRELVSAARASWPDGKGVGVVGMCLTGAFPLALLREPALIAAVLCQPTIPFSLWSLLGLSSQGKAELGISAGDLEHARDRRSEPILGIRYTGDRLCPNERFDRLTKEFGKRFHRLDILAKHHSTLGEDLCDGAFVETKAYLRRQLVGPSDDPQWKWPRYSVSGALGQSHARECVANSSTAHDATR